MVKMISLNWRRLIGLILAALAVFVYNEFLIYYLVLLQCSWPSLDLSQTDFSVANSNKEPLRVMVLADTHLLGVREGHWFDQLRREWQMERAFQTSMTIHNPDVVFVLGDLLDEGKWSSDADFYSYVRRFEHMFSHSKHTNLHVVVGNHDIGFHYMIDDHKRKRFASAFSAPSIRKLMIGGNIFVLLNSMAMEGDGCNMCSEAEEDLRHIVKSLDCTQGLLDISECDDNDKYMYSKPVLLQHFPLYRTSDSECSGPDEAPPEEKYKKFKEKMDCISKDSTEKLMTLLSPRLVISGHTHHGCFQRHSDGTPEWTVPSFNWRNKNNPSFILARISPNNFAVSKCYMPKESTIIFSYVTSGIILAVWFLFPWRLLSMSRTLKKH